VKTKKSARSFSLQAYKGIMPNTLTRMAREVYSREWGMLGMNKVSVNLGINELERLNELSRAIDQQRSFVLRLILRHTTLEDVCDLLIEESRTERES